MAEWRPTKVQTRPWADIARFYGEIRGHWNAHVSMQLLCQHVALSAYRDLLFGATSMHTLLVGQHETLEWNCNMLRVEPTTAERIAFSFHEKEFVEPVVWTAAPGAVVEAFERFVRRVKWVSEGALT
jgi:hypothetical protein